VAFWLPACPWLGNGLIRSSFVLAEHHQTSALAVSVRLLNQIFFSSVWGSWTITIPSLRTRSAVPLDTSRGSTDITVASLQQYLMDRAGARYWRSSKIVNPLYTLVMY
jgi:hypothetical protein